MSAFLSYLVMTIVSLGIVYVGYLVVLRSETFFRLNRVYLLIGLLVSFLFPLAGSMGWLPDVASSLFAREQPANTLFFGTVDIPAMKYRLIDFQPFDAPAAIAVPTADIPVVVVQPEAHASVHYVLTLSGLLWVIYLLVTLILYARFWNRLNGMWELRRHSETRSCDGHSVCVVPDDISPYSFFSTIFISRTIDKENKWNEIVRHEAVHIREGHSLDIVLIQFLKVFFWFNPFLYLVDRSLRETHEFQADAQVLKEGVDVVAYQNLLLCHLGTAQALGLSNNFNSSLIKRRLLMFTHKSNRWAKCKPFVMLPLALTVLFYYTSGCVSSADKKLNNNLSWLGIKGDIRSVYDTTFVGVVVDGVFQKGAAIGSEFSKKDKTFFRSSSSGGEDGWSREDSVALGESETIQYIYYDYTRKGGGVTWGPNARHDAYGNIVEGICHDGKDVTDGKEVYKFDVNNHRIESAYYDVKGIMRGKYTYRNDAEGHPIEIIRYDSKGNLMRRMTYKYDAHGDKTEFIHYGSDGRLINKITFKYDANDNPVEIIRYDSTGALMKKLNYKYVYDQVGTWIQKDFFLNDIQLETTERTVEYK